MAENGMKGRRAGQERGVPPLSKEACGAIFLQGEGQTPIGQVFLRLIENFQKEA